MTDKFVMPPLDEDLIEILGRPNFTCIKLAELFRSAGVVIPRKAENEQAVVIHFMLKHYFEHGKDWHIHAQAELQAMVDKVKNPLKDPMA